MRHLHRLSREAAANTPWTYGSSLFENNRGIRHVCLLPKWSFHHALGSAGRHTASTIRRIASVGVSQMQGKYRDAITKAYETVVDRGAGYALNNHLIWKRYVGLPLSIIRWPVCHRYNGCPMSIVRIPPCHSGHCHVESGDRIIAG